MHENNYVSDMKEVESLERMIEFTIDRVEALKLTNTANLLKLAKTSIIQDANEVIESETPKALLG